MTSLCVASVMMSTVVSRLKEIGIRIAVGYSLNQIQRLFIMEVIFIILMSSTLAILIEFCTN
jgi:ABC-type antimicrobial peptide transport system permease subunit